MRILGLLSDSGGSESGATHSVDQFAHWESPRGR